MLLDGDCSIFVERDKAFRMTTTTAHALLPLVSGTVVFPMDLRSIHTSRLEELYEIWYPDSEKPPRAHYSSHKRIMHMEHEDEAVQLTDFVGLRRIVMIHKSKL